MLNERDPWEDRRKSRRKQITIEVQLKIGLQLKGPGYTRDISEGGLLIKTPEIFCFFRPELAHTFQNADLTVFFPDESLIVKGQVVRIDASRKELAVRIILVSDDRIWKQMVR